MVTRDCIRCNLPFKPIPSFEDRLQARGSYQKVCASCALYAINDMAAEAVWEMTDEEIEAELREDGVDVQSFKGKVQDILREAMVKRQR